MLTRLDETLIEAVLERARQSARRRANHCFHRPEDNLQRMVNAALHDSYFRPHKHENPDKLEIFTILRGRAAILQFDDGGRLIDAAELREGGPVIQAEIPPRLWHGIVVLSGEAVLYEVIEGVYDPATHKRFAPFAPPEGSEAALGYLAGLRPALEQMGIRGEA